MAISDIFKEGVTYIAAIGLCASLAGCAPKPMHVSRASETVTGVVDIQDDDYFKGAHIRTRWHAVNRDVMFWNAQTNEAFSTVTHEHGVYKLRLPVGTYKLDVSDPATDHYLVDVAIEKGCQPFYVVLHVNK